MDRSKVVQLMDKYHEALSQAEDVKTTIKYHEALSQAEDVKTTIKALENVQQNIELLWKQGIVFIEESDRSVRAAESILTVLAAALTRLTSIADANHAELGGKLKRGSNAFTKTGAWAIYYSTVDAFRTMVCGYRYNEKHKSLPEPDCLWRTHDLLGYVNAPTLEAVFKMMQAENWSPNGEARPVIAASQTGHTSMSVGDIVQNNDTGVYWFCDITGWKELKP